ncbi:MAG: prolipoprotein diacylglyceryl transferase [Verrucomicrobiales bacterium]|nr:prolipoprotein diacylglyceryl transferase [Verrucomicrobiales bacterium]
MHKVAIKVFGFSIYWYGILVAMGFILGFWTAGRRARKAGLDPEKIMDLGPWLLLGAIVGARTLHVLSYWREEFQGKPFIEMFKIQNGGLVFYGGFIGASLATILYARWKKIPLWLLADVLAPSIPLGHFFGRLGCLMTGCCYGLPTTLPWAIHFPLDHETRGEGVHPVQIYESLLNLALYSFLEWFFPRRKNTGQIFALYLILYSLVRGFTELFRGDYHTDELILNGLLKPGQFVSLFLVVIGIVLLWKSPKFKPRPA